MHALLSLVCTFFMIAAQSASAMSTLPNPSVVLECGDASAPLCAALEQAVSDRFPERVASGVADAPGLRLAWMSEGSGTTGVRGYLTWKYGTRSGRGDSAGMVVSDRPGGMPENGLLRFATSLVNALELPE